MTPRKTRWIVSAALSVVLLTTAACDRNTGREAETENSAPLTLDATRDAGTITFTVFADSYQVYIYDSRTEPIFISEWNKQTIADKLVVKPGAIAFCPMREMDVPVTVRVHPKPPDDDLSAWDHVTECSLDVPSGRVLVLGPVDKPSARIDVRPGAYRVRISGGGFETISPNGIDGKDHYELCLWPADSAPPKVLKRHRESAPVSDPAAP